MILKITFNDNDFTQYIEKFLDSRVRNISMMVTFILNKYKDLEDARPYIEKSKYINDIVDRIFYSDKPSVEDVNAYIKLFRESFIYYIGKIFSDKSDIEYLTKNLEVTNVKSVKSKEQNGEVVYWFVLFGSFVTM